MALPLALALPFALGFGAGFGFAITFNPPACDTQTLCEPERGVGLAMDETGFG